ncbi:hypothetical protein O181_007330 [Austropuccinia psidii MF-1]|uniref:DNA repair protein RAD14 n=1 Tax=Austropuccinia psidii MF-1 TaxID=1389203 RepID=A0A9Q3BM64_9BASI|nr:hypothetical protein [Austropuccinia psidii MF-1]
MENNRDQEIGNSIEASLRSPVRENQNDQTKASIILRNKLEAKERIKQAQERREKQRAEVAAKDRKRLLEEAKGDQKDSTSPSKQLKPLPNMIGKFIDYDLTNMKNSKGGFLLNNEEEDQRALKQRQQIEELKKQRLKQAEKYNREPVFSLDKNQNPRCNVCGKIELDFQIFQVFGVPVCLKCRNEYPERFSLLTKTECKEDYLLTDPELKDSELLPHLLKPNPHQSTYSNMMLFLREQVEAYAFSDKKWGSPEALDEEFQRREKEKRRKKNKKFEDQLKELRKRTRTNVWHKRQEAVHVHQFQQSQNSNGKQVQRCLDCGLETECETF